MRELVPDRARIRASRLRDRGKLGEFKRRLFTFWPWLFQLEDLIKREWKRSKPVRDQLVCCSLLWEALFGSNGLGPHLAKECGRVWASLTSFHWVCAWCPPWIQKFRAGGGGPFAEHQVQEGAAFAEQQERLVEEAQPAREEDETRAGPTHTGG